MRVFLCGVALWATVPMGQGYAEEKPEPACAEALAKEVGKKVTVEGLAQNAKLGALVLVDGESVYLKDKESWESEWLNQRVRVKGILRTFEPPVATQKNGEWSAGVSQPGRAYRLEKAKWERVKPD